MISGFLEMLIAREYAPSSQARKLAAMKAMYRYLVSINAVAQDPSKDIGGARVAKKRPKIISVGEVDRLLAAAAEGSTPEGYRDSAMLELLYATGMRVSEIVALNDIDVDIRNLRVTCGRSTNRERAGPFRASSGTGAGKLPQPRPEQTVGRAAGLGSFSQSSWAAANAAGVLADHQGSRA